jgi:sulfate permease, SulP family
VGQVQDVGLIFLSSMATGIAAITAEAGLPVEVTLGTAMLWLSIATVCVGLMTVCVGVSVCLPACLPACLPT